MKDSSIYLSVISDDYGMCDAINDGAVRGFSDGLVTDASLMAPGPAFANAVQLAKAHHLPIGIHLTFTCEWHRLRWKSLTPCPSMTDDDGYFFPTVRRAWQAAYAPEVEVELAAQWERIESEGFVLTHVGEHMGADDEVLAPILRERVLQTCVPHRGFIMRPAEYGIPHLRFDSMFVSAGKSASLKVVRERLKEWLFSLRAGYHWWLCHCAIDHPSLLDMSGPGQPTHWTNTYRVIDMALVTDPQVREWIQQLGIKLVSVSQVPVIGFPKTATPGP